VLLLDGLLLPGLPFEAELLVPGLPFEDDLPFEAELLVPGLPQLVPAPLTAEISVVVRLRIPVSPFFVFAPN